MEYIMKMEAKDFLFLLMKTMEKEKEEQIKTQWTTMLPFMSMKILGYMSFEDYRDKCTGKNIDMRSTDEIIRDIEETHRKAHMKEGGESWTSSNWSGLYS